MIKLLQLFPAELSASGDSGNIQTVAYRLRARGFDVSVLDYTGEGSLPNDVHGVFLGNGPWSAAKIVLENLKRQSQVLNEYVARQVPIFAVGAGAEILGVEVTDATGETHKGLGILPLSALREVDRRVGYMKIVSEGVDFVGFGDFASMWKLDDASYALGEAVVGDRSSETFVEGVCTGSLVATRMVGPALPLNPVFADRIVLLVLAHAGLSSELSRLETDIYPENARRVILKHLDTHFATIAL